MVLTGSLDLFVLLVEYTTGSIMLSLFLWALVLLITGILGRMSITSISVIIITFLAVSSVGYTGALGAVPLFLFAGWYMMTGFINWINAMK